MIKDEALKLAMEALKRATNYDPVIARAITAIKETLAQPEQEPVAAECKFDIESMWLPCAIEHHHLVQSEPHKWPEYQTRLLYTTPPQRKPLTEGETMEIVQTSCIGISPQEDTLRFVKAIEAAHGIKELA